MDSRSQLTEVLGEDGVERLLAMLAIGTSSQGGGRSSQITPPKDKLGSIVPSTGNDVCHDNHPNVGIGQTSSGFPLETSDSFSWSDDVEAEDSLAGSSDVSFVQGVPRVSDEVRGAITFGGFGHVVGGTMGKSSGSGGMMAEFVRSPQAKAFKQLLSSINIKLPRSSAFDLALVTHTAATMPMFFNNGKERLKSFAVLGDSALVCALVASRMEIGATVESHQSIRTTKLTDGYMSRVFAKSSFARHVSVVRGVDLSTGKAGATALEALFGVVAFYRPPSDVMKLAEFFAIF